MLNLQSYSFVDGIGTVGFIPSISEPFCGNCDRLRISSDGKLLTCLYENPGYDLRSMLRGKRSQNEITEYILQSVQKTRRNNKDHTDKIAEANAKFYA